MSYMKKLCRLTGLSQLEIARRAGVYEKTLRRYTNMETNSAQIVEAILTVCFQNIGPDKNKDLLK